MYDLLIIGAGSAGLSCATYAARSGLKVGIIEALAPGGQLMYIDKIENYPGYEPISGFALADKMQTQAESFGSTIIYDEIVKIEKKDNYFTLKSESNEYEARAVVAATGAKHSHLGSIGESEYEGRGVSYCATCDGPFFKGKELVVVGGGDTALTEALYLAELATKVTLVHRRDSFRGQQILVSRVKEKENITLSLNHTIKSIDGDGKRVTSITLDDNSSISCDGVFIFTGIVPQSNLFKDIVELDSRGFIKTNEKLETSQEGVYAIGDVRDTLFRQVVTAVSDGALAAHMIYEYLKK